MADHNLLGKKGEELSLQYLKENGYLIKEKNWRFGKDEIDIIALNNDQLVIVEVKTRSTRFFGEPEFAVTKTKQRFLIRATHNYIIQNEIDLETRFDIISVVVTPEKSEIHHIKNAFYPTR